MNIAEMVRTELKERDLTPSDLARMTDLSPQYIHALLKDEGQYKKRWNETTLSKVCAALDIEIAFVPKE